MSERIAYGPVPSRRLGRSIGINNIPPKICSYSCIYCQLGKTRGTRIEREQFYEPERVFEEVADRVRSAEEQGEQIDYLTFVPDGEPTLDLNLKEEIHLVRELGFPVAIISNASLIWQEEVRDAIREADLVSLKVDAATERAWRRINRPHRSLSFERIQEGMRTFAKGFQGMLLTETMLVNNIDYSEEISQIAKFIATLNVRKAYLAIPTRPPAVQSVRPPSEETLNLSFQSFSELLGDERVEYLIGYEGNAFATSGNLEDDLLSITAVHPMREDAVRQLMERTDSTWSQIEKLVEQGTMIELTYQSKKYYMRKLPTRV